MWKRHRRFSADGTWDRIHRRLIAEADAAQYQAFRDAGMRDVRSHAGQDDLPKGHWVYVYPNWYIWGQEKGVPPPPGVGAKALGGVKR